MRRLVMFARRPRAGRVKTRLASTLGAEPVLELYRAFLMDQVRFVRSFRDDHDVELCMDGRWTPEPELAERLGDVRITRQGAGNLGRRLLACFERARGEGAQSTVIIGADSPTLPRSHVTAAFRVLASGAEAVFSPADDGGYVLLGLSRRIAALFRDIPWGGPDVAAVTLERARSEGIDLRPLKPWYDVDDEKGLRQLRAELARPSAVRRAPATAAVLARLDSSRPPVV